MPQHCPALLSWLIKVHWVIHFISWSVCIPNMSDQIVDTKEPKSDTRSSQTDTGRTGCLRNDKAEEIIVKRVEIWLCMTDSAKWSLISDFA